MKQFTETEKQIAKDIKRYNWIARNEDGTLWLFRSKPRKNIDYNFWNDYGSGCELPLSNLFSEVKWEDSEPTRIYDIYNTQLIGKNERVLLRGIYGAISFTTVMRDDNNCVSCINDDDDNVFCFWRPKDMFVKFEKNRRYTLDELKLFNDENK